MARRTAWSRRQSRRRHRRVVFALAAATAALYFYPALTAQTAAAWDRHVIAEARGDTAQAIALEVGRSLSLDDAPARVRVQETRPGICHVSYVGTPVSCDAKVGVKWRRTGFRVVVVHRNERFVLSG